MCVPVCVPVSGAIHCNLYACCMEDAYLPVSGTEHGSLWVSYWEIQGLLERHVKVGETPRPICGLVHS